MKQFLKKLQITDTVKRIAMWNIGVIILLFFIYSVYLLYTLHLEFENQMDSHIKIELYHQASTLRVIDDSVIKTGEGKNDILLTQITKRPAFFAVYDVGGNIIYESSNYREFANLIQKVPDFSAGFYFEDFFNGFENLRIGYRPLYNAEDQIVAVMQLGLVRTQFNEMANNLVELNIQMFPLFLLLILAISIFLAKKSYEPLNEIIDLAENISASDLSKRIEYRAGRDDELGRLKHTLNNLFGRLQAQFDQIKQFTDNASHQLMTPLTVMKSEIEFMLRKTHKHTECQQTMVTLKQEAERLILIVNTMLVLAREARETDNYRKVFNLTRSLRDELPAVPVGFSIETYVDDELYVRGKREYFLMVIQNLIENSVKYSNGSRSIKVCACREGEQVKVEVVDEGIGIPDEEKEKIFERFQRGTEADNSTIQGFGLGMSLVYSIVVNSMRGEIKVEDNDPRGTRVIMRIPAVQFED